MHWIEIIESPNDILCVFFFSCSHRQQDLYRILKAYTIYRPDEGYCQAQAPVAAVLLMHMPAEVSSYNCVGTHSVFVFKTKFKSVQIWRVSFWK